MKGGENALFAIVKGVVKTMGIKEMEATDYDSFTAIQIAKEIEKYVPEKKEYESYLPLFQRGIHTALQNKELCARLIVCLSKYLINVRKNKEKGEINGE